MKKNIFQFLLLLTTVIVVVFIIHLSILKINRFPLFQNRILLSYIINIFLAIGIYIFLYVNRIKYKAELGFLYMAGSFIKLLLFGLLLYPIYHKDGSISKLEFFTFFIPYVTCLSIETYSLVKVLNSKELN